MGPVNWLLIFYFKDGTSTVENSPPVAAGFISIDRFLQNRTPVFLYLLILLGSRTPASGPQQAHPFASIRLGVRFSRSIFGLQGQASCRDTGPKYNQKVHEL